jgi:MFS family permease
LVLALEGLVYAAIAPLLPQYAEQHNLSEGTAGLLVAAYPIGTLLATPSAAALSTWRGSKVALFGGLSILGAATLVFGFSHDTAPLLAARLVQGLGGAYAWVGGLSLLFRLAPPEKKGGLVGTVLGAAVLGLTLGPILGGLATELGTEAIFAGVAVGCFALVAYGKRMAVDDKEADDDEPGHSLRLSREILYATWILCLGSMLMASVEVLVPLRLADFGVSGLMIGAIFFWAALLEAVANPQAGRISDARGRRFVIVFGLLVAVAVPVMLALAATLAVLIAAATCVALAISALAVPGAALLSDASERAGQGQATAAGLLNIAWAGGGVAGGIAAGGLASALGWEIPFVALAGLAIATLGSTLLGGRMAEARVWRRPKM